MNTGGVGAQVCDAERRAVRQKQLDREPSGKSKRFKTANLHIGPHPEACTLLISEFVVRGGLSFSPAVEMVESSPSFSHYWVAPASRVGVVRGEREKAVPDRRAVRDDRDRG